jgi:hypothetical protein
LVYFANSEGLIEFNGITSRLYKLPYEKGVRSVCVNDSGTIFTGAFEDFGFWEPLPNGKSIIQFFIGTYPHSEKR